MFWITAVLLFVMWVLGLATGLTGDGLIHILPMLATAVLLLRVIERKPSLFARATSIETKSSHERDPQLQQRG